MIREYLIIRTTISRTVIKRVLLKGFCIALLGILGLVLGGIFLPIDSLQRWGWVIVFTSLGLVTLGLRPYRRLVRLQLKPNELSILDADMMTFISRGRKILTIPLQSISKISYLAHPLHDGIAVWLKQPAPDPVVIHDGLKEVEVIRKKGREKGADLFFSHFNLHAYEELIDWISEEE